MYLISFECIKNISMFLFSLRAMNHFSRVEALSSIGHAGGHAAKASIGRTGSAETEASIDRTWSCTAAASKDLAEVVEWLDYHQ